MVKRRMRVSGFSTLRIMANIEHTALPYKRRHSQRIIDRTNWRQVEDRQ